MLNTAPRCLLVVAVCLGVGGGVRAQYSRRTPIVEAAEKTRDGILTLKVIKDGLRGEKEVAGTGVIIDERGFAITNAHVVAGASSVTATLSDGTRVKCSVHASFSRYDLAVLRLTTRKKLKALTLAPGSDLMVGETVIAAGTPYGFANSVCSGIVSALGREIVMPSGETLTDLIQHSATINPGNSGGPLLNVNGEVIGINVAMRDGAQGLSFALNTETVKQVLSRHLGASKLGTAVHGLDVAEKVEPEGADRQKVVVKHLSSASPAARAGLKKGDVIVKMGHLKLRNRFDLERACWGYKDGESITATVLRDGKPATVAVPLGRTEVQVSSRSER